MCAGAGAPGAGGKKKRPRQKKKPGESEKLVNNYDRMLNRLRSQLSRLRCAAAPVARPLVSLLLRGRCAAGARCLGRCRGAW
jgi:hypothetical protein